MRIIILSLIIGVQCLWAQPVLALDLLGRLFSTPVERIQLDRLRAQQKNRPAETIVEENVIESQPVVLPDDIQVQGYVKRSDGKDGTVWINGEAMQEHSKNQDIQVGGLSKNSNRVPIKIQANGKHLRLKAGQVYDPETGRVLKSPSYSIRKLSGRIGDENTP